METEDWLVGWREIGKYVGRSAKTAQRWAHDGMPTFRDPFGRPITKPSLIDKYIIDLNRGDYNRGVRPWKGDDVDNAIAYVEEAEKARKDFVRRLIEAQKRPRPLV